MKIKKFINQKNIEIIILFFFIFLGILIIFNLEKKINYYEYLKSKSVSSTEQKPSEIINNNGKSKIEKVNIEIKDNEFNPKIINVNFGSKVILNIKVTEGYHNLYIQGYEVKSKNLPTNKSDELIFIASKSGIFKFSSQTGRYEKEPEGLLIIE